MDGLGMTGEAPSRCGRGLNDERLVSLLVLLELVEPCAASIECVLGPLDRLLITVRLRGF